jgi:Sigma-70 region 2
VGADEAAAIFAELRPYLHGVAYRLTSSWADAEDVVADSWPRWSKRADKVDDPRGWLTRVVARLAVDHLSSARVRRESYPHRTARAGRGDDCRQRGPGVRGRPATGRRDRGRPLLTGLVQLADRHGRYDVEMVLVNGDPGFVIHLDSDRPRDPKVSVYTFAMDEGRVAAIYAVLAPDKLSRLPGQPPAAAPVNTPRPS